MVKYQEIKAKNIVEAKKIARQRGLTDVHIAGGSFGVRMLREFGWAWYYARPKLK